MQRHQLSIILNKSTSNEFYDYGKVYFDEAQRIIANMPKLPSKSERRESEKI